MSFKVQRRTIYRGTSLIRKSLPLGPYGRLMPKGLCRNRINRLTGIVSRGRESVDTLPWRMISVTLHSHVHFKEICSRTCSRIMFSSVKPYSHTMSVCVSSVRAQPFRHLGGGRCILSEVPILNLTGGSVNSFPHRPSARSSTCESSSQREPRRCPKKEIRKKQEKERVCGKRKRKRARAREKEKERERKEKRKIGHRRSERQFSNLLRTL